MLIERLIALGAISWDVAGQASGSDGFALLATSNVDQIDRDALREALQQVQQDDVVDLFTWDQASFAFREAGDEGDPEAGQLVQAVPSSTIPMPVSMLLMESARRVDEWGMIKDQLPDGRSVPYLFPDREKAKSKPRAIVSRRSFLMPSMASWSLDQIVDETPVSSIDGYGVLHRLLVSSGAGLYRAEQMVSNGRQLLESGDGERAATLLRRTLAVDPSRSMKPPGYWLHPDGWCQCRS